ncbi:MAG: bifunctional nuclease family protein [Nitrososphaeria archaeon]
MFVKVEIKNLGYVSDSCEGIVEFLSEDGKTFTMNSFSSEVSYHINRFMTGDRNSIPTVYNLVEELAHQVGVELEKVEIYERGNVLRANVYFIGRNRSFTLENYRASDAVALAAFYNMPIYIDDSLLT